jgi:hypothetical protein
LERAILAAKLRELGFEQFGPMHGPGVHRLPVPDLLPQFGILTAQFVEFLAQLEDFATKLSHQFGQTSRLGGRERVDKRGVHNTNACNPDLPSMKGPGAPQKRVRRSGTVECDEVYVVAGHKGHPEAVKKQGGPPAEGA